MGVLVPGSQLVIGSGRIQERMQKSLPTPPLVALSRRTGATAPNFLPESSTFY